MTRRIIGLTGGIATGKSTVARYLQEAHGVPVLDADVYAREAVAIGSEALAAIADRYGPEMLLNDGSLNRRRLGDRIFSQAADPAEKRWLELQIHPFVRRRFDEATQTFPPEQTLVYDIPLLFESKLTHLVSEIWVVSCSDQQQCDRLMQRSQLSADAAQARIAAQMPLTQKCAQADIVLDNSGTIAALHSQIDQALLPCSPSPHLPRQAD